MGEELLICDWIREKVLGSGCFGVVTLWRNIKTNEEFAIKMCKWGDELTPKQRERWSKEVEMMNQIKHDNIIGTRVIPKELLNGLSISNVSRLPILCMEYCGLGDLRQVLNKPEYGNGLQENQVRSVLNDIKNALSYLHSFKITHRDLKPENILVHQDIRTESNVRYKLIDLGYAKEIDSNSVCGSFVGTLQYLAPELLYSKTYSNTVDYWSFGLVAFEVITGIRPFLPNLPPVHWMQLVKQKTREHICVFENLKGEVEYSETIFSENHISSCFKGLLEKWLKIALDWDPKKRGHNLEDKAVKFLLPNNETIQENPKESSLVIFSLLEVILSKKILSIFSVATYEYLSYEIDSSTLMSTVQVWVERDTKVPIGKQLFISKSCLSIDLNSFAHQYWDEKTEIMMYFFQIDCLVNDNVSPYVPTKLKYCLENPKLKLSYSHLCSVFSNTLHFISSQKLLYETFIKAFNFRILHLKNEMHGLTSLHNQSEKIFVKLIDKCNLLSSVLDINHKAIDNVGESPLVTLEYKALLAKCETLKDKAVKLSEAWTQLTTRLYSAGRRCSEINGEEIAQKMSTSDFLELEKFASNYYSQIRLIPREERGIPRPCQEAVKSGYKCLKLRDILLRNIQNQQIMQKVLDISFEVEKMKNLPNIAAQNAAELSKKLSDVILEKEVLTLKMLCNQLPPNSDVPYLPTTLNGHGDEQPLISFRIGDSMRSPRPSYAQPVESSEIKSLVNDNISIQMASQAVMKQFYDKYKSIQEDMEIDFSYLNDS